MTNKISFMRKLRALYCVMLAAIQFRSFCHLSKNVKTKIYEPIILPALLCGSENWVCDIKEKTWTEGIFNLRGMK